MFAQRTEWELAPNKLTGILNRLKSEGRPIIDLTESNPTRCQFPVDWGKIIESLNKADNAFYTPHPKGMLKVRQGVADYYRRQGFAVDPDRIFLTASTSEAYSFLFRLLANPGDAVLFPRPSYPLFQFLADLNDVKLQFYSLEYDEVWRIKDSMLRSQLDDRVKALVLVNPNNPTGSCISARELQQINKTAQTHNLPIICDEVFIDYLFEERAVVPSLVTNQETLTFVMGGLSKTLGLPQMKLSWIVVNGPDHLVSETMNRLEVIADTFLSVNTPSQNALNDWLLLQPHIQQEIRSRIRSNRQFLTEHLNVNPVGRCLAADGGWYAVLKLNEHKDEETLVEELLERDGVYAHPGYFFDFDEETFLVLSLLPEKEVFQTGVRWIIERIKK